MRNSTIYVIYLIGFFSFLSSSAQELIFKTGFEGNVSGFPSSAFEFLEGSDNYSGTPNDWVRDLDNHPEIGLHRIQYEGNSSSRRYARLAKDPKNPANKTMIFNISQGESNSNRTRVQMNLFNNKGLKQFTQTVSLFLHWDIRYARSYPEKFDWFNIFEIWNNVNQDNEPYPFRISVNLVKLYEGFNDEFFFEVHGQTYNGNGWDDVWVRTNKNVAVPTGEWMELEYYFKEGDKSAGRFSFTITKENGERINIFSVSDYTHHPKDPNPDGVQRFNPMKLYTFKDLVNHVRDQGRRVRVYWDDFTLWRGDARNKYPISSIRADQLSIKKYTFKASGDSYTDGSNTGSNYGSRTYVDVSDRSNKNEGYYKFSVGNFRSVSKAKLRLYGWNPKNSKQSVRVRVFRTADEWNEDKITFKNAPVEHGGLIDQVYVQGKKYYEWDVTDYVKQQTKLNGRISFLLVSRDYDSRVARFNSTEASSNKPQLVIEGVPENVGPKSQYITFDPIPDRLTSQGSLTLNAKSTSGLSVNYEVISGPASVSGSTLRFNGSAGLVEVLAKQNGNSSYLEATPILRRFRVIKTNSEAMYVLSEADAQVINGSSNSGKNYGDKEFMEVRNKSSYGSESYIRFDLSGIKDISNAKLRLRGRNPANSKSVNIGVFKSTDNWSESALTFKNRPKALSRVGGTKIANQLKYYEVDVTSYVKSELGKDKTVTFVVRSENNNYERVRFDTRETRGYAPELKIVGTPNLSSSSNAQARVAVANSALEFDAPAIQDGDWSFKTYPNPFQSYFSMEISGKETAGLRLKVMDIHGRIVYENKELSPVMDVYLNKDVPPGVYVVQLIEGLDTVGYQKMIKD